MKISRRSSLVEVAAVVARHLASAHIDAVLTGGACATMHSDGAHLSYDLDFVVRSGGNRQSLDSAMGLAGFSRDGDYYRHPETPFFVEFPRGPLAIGGDLAVTPVTIRVGGDTIRALSPTDACRDRLAAFYHWSDRQSLNVAVAIARRRRVSFKRIATWSEAEGHTDRYQEFLQALKAER